LRDSLQGLSRLRVNHKIWRHLVSKPRHLAFGILAGVIDGDLTCLFERQLAPEMPEELRLWAELGSAKKQRAEEL